MNPIFFQSLSLPRSGSAFLATFFNLNPQAICLHEPAGEDCEPINRAIHRLSSKFLYVGVSDTMAGVYTMTQLPNARAIYVARDIAASRNSTERALGIKIDGDYFNKVLDANIEWAFRTKAMIVSFNDLFQEMTLLKIWNHVFRDPICPFPADKVKHLVSMNIQRHNPAQAFLPSRELLKTIH